MSPEQFQQKVLDWYDVSGRKNLPWQQEITPYRIWLSEVMLQQTKVTTVIPYYNQFINSFPDIFELANASLDSVLQLWSGLGYYARARNLHKTANIICESSGGLFPNDLSSMLELPGIGRSTAGAILSIAFNNSYPILDGNVKRVLARYHAISGWTGHTKVSKELWALSSYYTPVTRVAEFTQAMMDIGATLCTRSKPGCDQCPINSSCLAKKENRVNELPTPKPKIKLPVKRIIFLILQDTQKQLLLQKRSPSGIWGGLWSLLEFNSLSEIKAWCMENNFSIQSVKQLDEQRHTFSHFHLDYTAIFIKIEGFSNKVKEANQSVWYKAEQITALGLPAPIKRLIQNNIKEENMTKMIKCMKLGVEAEALESPPFPGPKGQFIYENISKQAWQEWMNMQTMIINEQRLASFDPKAKKLLEEEREKFLFSGDFEMPEGYVPQKD